MQPNLIVKALLFDNVVINDFSRLCPLVHNKLNGPPVQGCRERATLIMAEKRNSKKNVSIRTESASTSRDRRSNSGNCSVVSSHLSGVQGQRNQESIVSAPLGNMAWLHYQYPYTFPVQLNSNFYYRNFSQAVLQPNLSNACFHRPQPPTQERRKTQSAQDSKGFLNGLRYWEKITGGSRTNGFKFSVMCYNVLAQDLVNQHPHLYSSHIKNHLKWSVRWSNLFAEIKKLNPDFLCLQEVQGSHLSDFSLLKTLGYEGIYKQRTGVRTDGCAIYYKRDLVTMIEHTTVEYYQPSVSLLNRDNVAIIARFAPKISPKNEFVIATTHLLYNPKRADVRLAQTQLLLTEIERIAFNPTTEGHPYLPVIVTGDLNSTPDSVVYRFMDKAHLKYEHLSEKNLENHPSKPKMGKIFLPPSLRITDQCQHAGLLSKRYINKTLHRSEEEMLIELQHSERNAVNAKKDVLHDKMNFASGVLTHQFPLKSVYGHGVKGDVEGTTFQDQWVTVDYIFYSIQRCTTGKFVLLERYRLPTKSQLGEMKIPNGLLGSDHMSLLAKFKLEF